MSDNIINYDALTRVYSINVGATSAEIQTIINTSHAGAILQFGAGTYMLENTLDVYRSDISLIGAGKKETVFQMNDTHAPASAIEVKGGFRKTLYDPLDADIKAGDNIITLKNASYLKADDYIRIQAENTESWLVESGNENIIGNINTGKNTLRENIVQIESIDGDVVTLKQPVDYDMQVSEVTIKVLNLLENVSLKDFSVNYDLGEIDDVLYQNTLDAYKKVNAIQVDLTAGINIESVKVANAPSHALEVRSSLQPYVNDYTADGSYNKGGGGNGYGLHLVETFHGKFEDLELLDMRHSFVFSSWSAENHNDINISFMNRDLNYHGSNDTNNKVVIENAAYDSGDLDNLAYIWPLVKTPNSFHPHTDMDANQTLFANAYGSEDHEFITGWDNGARLHGNGGNDLIIGGDGNDIIYGGNDNDILLGGDGRDYLYGGYGDDVLNAGAGSYDRLYGGEGADTFVLNGDDATDGLTRIVDYNMDEGDILEINAVLMGYDPLNDLIDDFITINESAYFTRIFIDRDGLGDNYENEYAARLEGVTNMWNSAQDMVDQGMLVIV